MNRTDARNRAIRTFVQNLGIDVLVAVLVLLYPIVVDAQSMADFQWQIIAFSVAKTIIVTGVSYTMRALGAMPGSLEEVQGK